MSGGQKVAGTVAEGAGAKGGFARLGKSFGGGKEVLRTAEGVAQAGVNLADLDDLFEGGADEVGEAFPRVLAQRAEAGVLLKGGAKVWI